MAALIRKLLDIAWDQWDCCNEMLHVGQAEEVASAYLLINAEIQRELELGPSNLPLRMSFLFPSILYEELMRTSLEYCHSWLTKVQAA